MRFILFLILLGGAAFAGWIAGSLHPAPAAILTPIQNYLSGDVAEPQPENPDGAPTTGSEPLSSAGLDAESTSSDAASSGSDSGGTLEQYRAWISEARAAHPYPESEEKMFEVMMCESGGRADVVNPAGPYSGLFQYVAGTWAGDWNQYRDSDILDARAQIFATALAWNNNMQSHWGCYSRSH
ncbi:MAG: hypothetical protein AAF642_13245 [Pseudomonadota bacterium]